VAKVSELTGAEPLRREVVVEHREGWGTSRRAHAVYVLPRQEGRVISSVCPHEGCEVEWEEGRREFLCPCHDSRFGPEGARLGGPALQDLAQIPSRINGDALEVQSGAVAPAAEQAGEQA
jgi:Rieske Fe-S protein